MKVHNIRFAFVFESCLREGEADGATLRGATIRAKPMACVFGRRSGVEVRVVWGFGTKKASPTAMVEDARKTLKRQGSRARFSFDALTVLVEEDVRQIAADDQCQPEEEHGVTACVACRGGSQNADADEEDQDP